LLGAAGRWAVAVYVLRCVAVCCSALQCVVASQFARWGTDSMVGSCGACFAVCCSDSLILAQPANRRCGARVAVCCSMWQCVAARQFARHGGPMDSCGACVAVCCGVLRCA